MAGEPYSFVRKDFACNLKRIWYNVDIRTREERRNENEKASEKFDCQG